jgi:hypothetical protein
MQGCRHSGFSVDNSVRIASGDRAGMQRLIECISRCPFSLARMIALTPEGWVLYRAATPSAYDSRAPGTRSSLPATRGTPRRSTRWSSSSRPRDNPAHPESRSAGRTPDPPLRAMEGRASEAAPCWPTRQRARSPGTDSGLRFSAAAVSDTLPAQEPPVLYLPWPRNSLASARLVTYIMRWCPC